MPEQAGTENSRQKEEAVEKFPVTNPGSVKGSEDFCALESGGEMSKTGELGVRQCRALKDLIRGSSFVTEAVGNQPWN